MDDTSTGAALDSASFVPALVAASISTSIAPGEHLATTADGDRLAAATAAAATAIREAITNAVITETPLVETPPANSSTSTPRGETTVPPLDFSVLASHPLPSSLGSSTSAHRITPPPPLSPDAQHGDNHGVLSPMPPLQPPPLPPLPPPSAGCRHAGEPRHAGVVTFADVVEYLVRVCRPTVTDKTVLLASAVCVVVLAAAIAINASGGNSDTPLRLHDWVGDAFSRDVLFQSRQPCTIITPTELARSTVLAAGNRRYSLRHVGTNLCRALDQVGASAVPMLVFGPGYDRCVIATRIESKCTVLVNARIGEESDHVQASLLSIVFNLTHAVRTLPRQLTVSCTAWTEGQGVESAERLRLQDASAIVVAHWLQTGARGNYSDLS